MKIAIKQRAKGAPMQTEVNHSIMGQMFPDEKERPGAN